MPLQNRREITVRSHSYLHCRNFFLYYYYFLFIFLEEPLQRKNTSQTLVYSSFFYLFLGIIRWNLHESLEKLACMISRIKREPHSYSIYLQINKGEQWFCFFSLPFFSSLDFTYLFHLFLLCAIPRNGFDVNGFNCEKMYSFLDILHQNYFSSFLILMLSRGFVRCEIIEVYRIPIL